MGKAGAALRALDKNVRDATLQAVINTSDDLQSNARDVVRRWKSKVDFGDKILVDRWLITCLITPKGRGSKIFGYVDMGTKPHIISPKIPGGYLKFRVGYSARTTPVAKYNVGSGKSFGAWVQKRSVNHPGTKPRKFLVTFMDELIPTFQNRVQTEINRKVS
jgi:hypothetical protein